MINVILKEMEKNMKQVDTFSQMDITLKRLKKPGLLLISGKKGNPMTIGWASIGIIWRTNILTVLVRPSRFSFNLMEKSNEFAVGVPREDMKEEVLFCGKNSGRDVDKINECGFTQIKAHEIEIPLIKECEIHYECRIVHKNQIIPAELDEVLKQGNYPSGDFHTLYYGEMLGVYTD